MARKQQVPACPTPPVISRNLLRLESIAKELGRIYRAMRRGEIETQDGTRLAYVLRQLSDVLELLQLEARITALENQTAEESDYGNES
ncbi:MAG: hypothetical protein M0Z84_03980 [Gammaproteobacteria bacterium]|nr:hypothetical protein [Gammaproteobacteria bacterium]